MAIIPNTNPVKLSIHRGLSLISRVWIFPRPVDLTAWQQSAEFDPFPQNDMPDFLNEERKEFKKIVFLSMRRSLDSRNLGVNMFSSRS